MRTTTALTLSALLTLAGCSREVATAVVPAAAVTLPPDVKDLAKKPATQAAKQTAIEATEGLPQQQPQLIAATGELISPMRSQVAPRMPGRVAAVFVREGQKVAAGQPLAAFETEYLRLDLHRAEAELTRAKAMEKDAERDLARKRELVDTESVSRATFERAQTAYESAVAARQAADSVVATISQRIEDSVLRAPFDGVIETKSVNVGEHIGDGQAAFVIAQTSTLKLRFRLPEQYLGTLREGQHVTAASDAFAASTFEGSITMIGGVIESSTRTLVAEADINNSEGRLRPGMFARVTIER